MTNNPYEYSINKNNPFKRPIAENKYLKQRFKFIIPLAKELEDMAETFCSFSKDHPELEKQQFARHLLWHLRDYEYDIATAIRHGATAFDFDFLWIFLFFYFTGEEYYTMKADDDRVIQFGLTMYRIMNHLFVRRDIDFDYAMSRVIEAVEAVKHTPRPKAS